MSDNIPFDIQIEIIKKVPDVKSLVRFRSVSKPWKSYIDSSEFIAYYGVRHTQPHRLLLRYKDVFSREVNYVSLVDDENLILTQQQDFAPNVTDLVKQIYNSTVIGSSYGLWCLHGYDSSETEMVAIWNPSIKKSVGIVVPRVLNDTSDKVTLFGFGVCPSTYDPTIVRMSKYKHNIPCNIPWQVEIFTLSSKTWIPSSNLPRESIRCWSSTQVAIDRFIFLAAYIAPNDGAQYKNLILSFDLVTHEFKEVNLPDSIANRFSGCFSISKLNESLVVFAYTDEVNDEVNDELVYGIWMMGDEGGVMTSFTKLFNFKEPYTSVSKVLGILGFRKNSEPIMVTVKDYEIAALEVYEPCSEHINNIGIYGENGSFFICPYTEALLLIDHSDGFSISNNY